MKAITGISIGAITLLAAVVMLGWQRARISSLEAERAALQAQSEQTQAAPETKPPSGEPVVAAAASTSSTDTDELLRLRAQASRLRQLEEENALLKNQLQGARGRSSPNAAAVASSQPPATAASPDGKPASTTAESTDLGQIEFTEGTPKRFDLGDGKTCTVNPVLFLNDKLTIEVKIDSADSRDPTSFRLVAAPGKQVGIWDPSGKLITLTPTVKAQ